MKPEPLGNINAAFVATLKIMDETCRKDCKTNYPVCVCMPMWKTITQTAHAPNPIKATIKATKALRTAKSVWVFVDGRKYMWEGDCIY